MKDRPSTIAAEPAGPTVARSSSISRLAAVSTTRRAVVAMSAACFVCGARALPAQAGDSVWIWSSACRSPHSMQLTAQLDRRTIYTATFPACLAERQEQTPAARMSFPLVAPRRLMWYGYRSDAGESTAAGKHLTVEVWQAGGDPEDMLLGVVVQDDSARYLHTILILDPHRQTVDSLTPGLVIRMGPTRSLIRRALPTTRPVAR
jgi:hypothetical protein